jgi:Arc/MetJ-type ribon-helix-helix transcriptional regulator
MATTKPRARRATSARTSTVKEHEAPWNKGDPAKKIGINIPFPEPLMLQLDYLIEHRAIHSKSSFIRDAVAAAATNEVEKLRRVQEAVRRIEEEDRGRR